MTNRMITIKANGIEDYTVCTTVPTLEELQTTVRGYIEPIPGFNTYKGTKCVALCNEEGRLMGMNNNIKATNLWLDAISPSTHGEMLNGDIVILVGDDAFLEKL